MRLFTYLVILLFSTPVVAEPQFWKWEWKNTDFEKSSVNFREIESGGPGKDGIPAIDNPKMIAVSAEKRLADREPVMTVEMNGEARAYPIRYLMWHEIANDVVGGIPVIVTYCPLCNSGIVFDGRVNGQTLTFGVSGKLRNSDMVMYDRQTESWWQQFIGEAIVGELLGTKLNKLPGWMESWGTYKARNPDGKVMDQPRFARRYGSNPYALYDSANRPFLYRGEDPPHGVKPLERVVAVEDTAWPLTRVAKEGVIKEKGYTIEWAEGMASAMDTNDISKGREVGEIRVKDAQGNDVPHDVAFAFAFHAFFPNGEWMLGR